MQTLFTADTHFGHAAARALYRRPFPTVAAMDEAMVERWNAVVGEADEVFHLGDFAVRHPDPAGLLARLHGTKHLLIGNNDPASVTALPGWHSVQPYLEIAREETTLVLCHYALRSWRDMGRGALNLHGHSHGRLAPMTRQFDVGVDARAYAPVTLAQLRAARRLLRKPAGTATQPAGTGARRG